MTVAVTDDMTCVDPAESVTNWNTFGAYTMEALLTCGEGVQGCGAIGARVGSGCCGVGGAMVDLGACCTIDISNTHLYVWLYAANPVNSTANCGFFIQVSDEGGCNPTGSACFGRWKVGGSDKGVRSYNGWFMAVIDTSKAFDSSSCPPALCTVRHIGGGTRNVSSNGKEVPVIDQVKFGSKIFVKGGTCACPGTFDEMGIDDECVGRGLFKKVGGVFFVNGKVEFGDASGTSSTEFRDTSQVIVYEDQPVSSTHYEWLYDGNSTGTNNFKIGTEVGCGITSKGVDGITMFSSSTNTPAAITASDSTMNQVQFFGSSFINSGLMNLTQTNVKIVSSTISGGDSITLGSGAEMRTGSVVGSIAASGVGAVILTAGPTCPEFRDMCLINNIHALENEVSGPLTWNLRNINFSGNTQDIRFNHTSGLLTVNVLEKGDTPTTSDGGAGGTISVLNTVTLDVLVVEGDFSTINVGSRVAIHLRVNPFTEFMNEETDGTGHAVETFNFVSDQDVFVRVRDEGFNYVKGQQ